MSGVTEEKCPACGQTLAGTEQHARCAREDAKSLEPVVSARPYDHSLDLAEMDGAKVSRPD